MWLLRMQRVVIMGPPGSGKSTLARHIGTQLGLPVFHLDQAYWQRGWIETPSDVFRAEVERIAALPAWVIDGNYTETIAVRLCVADTLIYLDVPSWLSIMRIARRTLTSYGRVRADAAHGCAERLDPTFLRIAWNWNRTSRARNLAIVDSFSGRKIVIRGRHALRSFYRHTTETIEPLDAADAGPRTEVE
jgi:adenylate kinase family enzyme